MTPLCELAAKYGTDKLRHGYTPFYHGLFEQWRDQTIDIVEIGVHKGASIRMWRDYFPNAVIHAVDNNSDAVASVIGIPGVRRIMCDARDAFALEAAFEFSVKIVIDDGSHVPADQYAAFHKLFPRISTGGYYVIEDLHAGWAWDNGHHGFIEALAAEISEDIHDKRHFLGPFPDVHFYRNLVAIRKN